MTKPSEGELRERNVLGSRYMNHRKRDKIDDQVRGIRVAINFLIETERELIAESEALKPARSKA